MADQVVKSLNLKGGANEVRAINSLKGWDEENMDKFWEDDLLKRVQAFWFIYSLSQALEGGDLQGKVEDFIKVLDGNQTFSDSKKTNLFDAIRDFQSGTSEPCDVIEGLSEELKNLQNEKCEDL